MIHFLRFFVRRFKDPPGSARVLVLLAGVLCYGTTGFLYFELPANGKLAWTDAIWWTIVTLTTVGYGDFFPTTTGGRYFIAVPLMLLGIGLLGYVLSLAASSLIEARSRELAGLSTMNLKNHTIVINIPNIDKVKRLLHELRNDGGVGVDAPVVLVDEDLPELPPELLDAGARYVRGNPARDETLVRAGIDDCSQTIILSKRPGDPHSDDLNLAITLAVEGRNSKVRTIAECIDPAREELFRKAGCDSIVCTSRFDAHFLGSEVVNPGVQDVVDELLSCARGQQFCFIEVDIGGVISFEEAAALCRSRGHIAIGIRRGSKLDLNAHASVEVKRGDEIVTIGRGRLEPLRAR